ncbi:MAG: hypothetical protein BIFFINMI_03838 [Phycisphaerae bacterium]|nr:hypothetical protein [Phycisphaerae bacterium]
MVLQAENPWRRLPRKAPYLLPEDKALILKFNESAREGVEFHYDLLPEPFLGRPDAPVVLLNKNPGYSPNDLATHTDPAFATKARGNLLHKGAAFPFYLLDPAEVRALGYKWWTGKLKSLVKTLGPRSVAQSVLCVEYFPYHSRRFGNRGPAVPSQKYSFDLVRSATSRNALIVVMRGKKLWFEAVPELRDYRRLYHVRNPQNPSISLANCPDGYEAVVMAIRGMAP